MSDAPWLREAGAPNRVGKRFCALIALLTGMLVLPVSAQRRAALVAAPRAAAGRPQLELQIGHTGIVGAVRFSADGRTLISAGQDGVRVWAMPIGLLERTQAIPFGGIAGLALSPDGALLAQGSGRQGAALWDTRTGQRIRMLASAGAPFLSLVFSPDGERLAGGGWDGQVTLWDAGTGQVLRRLPGMRSQTAPVFAPDGTVLACVGEAGVTLWDVRTGALRRTLAIPATAGLVTALAFSPNGETLAAGTGLATTSEVVLWDARTGAVQRRLTAHTSAVRALAFSHDGRLLAGAAGAPDGSIILWERETGVPLRSMVDPRYRRGIASLAFAPNGLTIAAGTQAGAIQLWNPRTGALWQRLGRSEPMLAAAASPDGKQIASGGADGAIRLWNAETGALARVLTGASGPVPILRFSPDGATLASRSEDGAVILWDAATGAQERRLEGVRWAAPLEFAAGGELLASGAGSTVLLWDRRTGKPRSSFRGHTGVVLCLAASRYGDTLASGSGDGTVRLWEVRTGRLLRTFSGPDAGEAVGRVFAVALSPDGSTLAAADRQGQIQMWSVPTGALLRTIPARSFLTSLTFSPDGGTLTGAGSAAIVRLWDAQSGAVRRSLLGHTHQVSSVAFFPGGKRIVTAGWDQTLRIWSAEEGRLLATMVVLPPADGGSELASARGSTDWLTVTPAGFYDGSPGAGRFIQWQVGSDRFPMEAYEPLLHRPALLHRILSGAALTPSARLQRFEAGQAIPPRIQFSGIHDGQVVSGDLIRIELVVSNVRPVSRVELLIDGRPVNAKPIEVGAKPIEIGAKPIEVGAEPVPAAHRVLEQFRIDAPLPAGEPEMTLKAVAYGADGLQGWAVARLTRAPSAPVSGDLYTLAVGISHYQNPHYDLKYAAADAQAFAGLWPRMAGTLYRRVAVTTLTDVQATAAGIRAALAHLPEQVTHNDTLMLFLSGHGIQAGDGQFYFAPHDVDASTSEQVARTALPWTVFETLLASVPAKRVFLFLDACHAGSALGEQQASNERLAEALARHGGVLVFSSSRGSEYSYEDDALGHGAFTAALLEGIGEGKADLEIGGRRDGVITVEELLAYLRARVPQLTMNRQTPSCPLIYDFGEAFLLARAR